MKTGLTRRQVTVGAGAFAAGSLSSLKAGAAGIHKTAGLLLVDGALPEKWVRELTSAQGSELLILENELVRQWRSGLRRQVISRAGATTALVKWDKFMVLEGLAREDRLAVSSERIDRQTFLVTL